MVRTKASLGQLARMTFSSQPSQRHASSSVGCARPRAPRRPGDSRNSNPLLVNKHIGELQMTSSAFFAKLGIAIILSLGAISTQLTNAGVAAELNPSTVNSKLPAAAQSQTVSYQLDAAHSKFVAHAHAGGLFWFEGHDHYLAAHDFSGQAVVTPQSIVPASLRLVVKADSLEETGKDFTPAQKQIINKEVHDLVLQPDQYPEIILQSTAVSTKAGATSPYEIKIDGDLTLHGVTKRVSIPVKLTLDGNDMRAVGSVSINRKDFNVKATAAVHGLVRVRESVTLEFDIVGHRM